MQQKCLAVVSSINYASVDAPSPLPGVREVSTSVPPYYQTYSSNKTFVSNNKDCEAHHCLFCLLCFVSSQKIGDYGMHRVRAEVETATCLWMAAKFCWFRAELNWQTEQSCKKSGWKTVHSTVWSLYLSRNATGQWLFPLWSFEKKRGDRIIKKFKKLKKKKCSNELILLTNDAWRSKQN